VSDETSSQLGSNRAVTRWLGAFKAVTRKSKDGTSIDDLARMESV